MTGMQMRWHSKRLRGLYPAYANGNTYLCEQGTGTTRGVIYGDGSGHWEEHGRHPRVHARGPTAWQTMPNRAGLRVEVHEKDGEWSWQIRKVTP